MAPGLSILIPVFNRDVAPLVDSLIAQTPAWGGPVEIRLLDDGSEEKFRVKNRSLATQTGVRYAELPHNVGRAAIRNRLAAAAQHEWLLLLDNDSVVPDQQFLARYRAGRDQAAVLVGGTRYPAQPPAPADLRLRWLYGQAREARPAAIRQQAPHAQLAINNVLLRAEVLARFPLDERLRDYGHEDTLFGQALARAGVRILHLDNPVVHEGLDPAAAFLLKSEAAVRNLVRVFREDGAGTDSRLLQTALRLRAWRVQAVARALLRAAEPGLRRNLLSARPSLRAFDALKLHWLLELL